MNQKLLEEYQKELLSKKKDVEDSKEDIINMLKSWKKEEIFEKEEVKKLTLWMRIKKVLGF